MYNCLKIRFILFVLFVRRTACLSTYFKHPIRLFSIFSLIFNYRISLRFDCSKNLGRGVHYEVACKFVTIDSIFRISTLASIFSSVLPNRRIFRKICQAQNLNAKYQNRHETFHAKREAWNVNAKERNERSKFSNRCVRNGRVSGTAKMTHRACNMLFTSLFSARIRDQSFIS